MEQEVCRIVLHYVISPIIAIWVMWFMWKLTQEDNSFPDH